MNDVFKATGVKVLAVDFDGVIAKAGIWKGKETADMPPVDLDAMKAEFQKLRNDGWKIIVWTARSDIDLVNKWLAAHDLSYKYIDAVNLNPWAPENLKTTKKIPANVYLDDRGLTFSGRWEGIADAVRSFQPWEAFDAPLRPVAKDTGDKLFIDATPNPDFGPFMKCQRCSEATRCYMNYHGKYSACFGNYRERGNDVCTEGKACPAAGYCKCYAWLSDKAAEEESKTQKEEDEMTDAINENQTPRTSSPCKNSPFLGTLPGSVLGYKPDQIAFFVEDAVKASEAWEKMGIVGWVRDVVTAKCLYPGADVETEFKVSLCFNYDLFPVEFELISVVEGFTAQIPSVVGRSSLLGPDISSGLSHLGFHVEDIDIAVEEFAAAGFPLINRIETTNHEGCDHRYTYVFIDTQALGFITKLIRRTK